MKIALAFASGTADLNRAMLDDIAARRPDLPLYVVSEFTPHRGEWIPWHVLRPVTENKASIIAATAGHEIAEASVAFATGTALGPMRKTALAIAPGKLRFYGFGSWARDSARELVGPFARWGRRFANPREMEIPMRARTAQLYGIAAARLRHTTAAKLPERAESLPEGISVVIPTRDGRELLHTLLPTLIPQLASGEIIVVDNGSRDETPTWLRETYPAIRIIESKEPLSFARAANAGISAARYAFTLLLNNDMVLEPGFVAALRVAFAEIPDLFCATAQIFFPEGIRREETGKAVWRRSSELDYPLRCDEPLPGEDGTWVLYGSGGCSLFDTAKLRDLDGVSEVYEPAYVEDLDLGYRAWKRGWPSVFCAGARVEHRHRATTSRFFGPRDLDHFLERNYLRFVIHAVGERSLFKHLWVSGIRRLQLLATQGNGAALDTLRRIPRIGRDQPAPATGLLSEEEIFALGNGDVAAFPGHASPDSGPRAVVVSPYLPFPLSHGGAVRIFNLMRQAAHTHALALICFCDELATPPAELLDLCAEVVLVRRHGSHYRRNTEAPDTVEEFRSTTFRACLKQTAARWKPDVIQFEFTWMAQYADAYPQAKSILVEHDITFDLQQQLLETRSDTGAERLELENQLQKWRAFETKAWRDVDCVVTMSAKDAATVTGAREVAIVPNGVDCERFQPSVDPPERRRLLFIGSFAHLPNLLALDWFLLEVWPLLKPGYRLHVIAGSRPQYYLDFHRSRVSPTLSQSFIELEGFVSDVRPAYRRAELVLAPLTASAGTNIKVLEAMAMGRLVIGTPAGFNGIDVISGVDAIVAASPAEFAKAIEHFSEGESDRREIEARARITAVERFDWSAIGKLQATLWTANKGSAILG
ncbi:MAG TPA: glycosyltransferase [Bryobacteraceae bacterium]|nr:glycosyltransferase [Bryobacteraceae bacterium]